MPLKHSLLLTSPDNKICLINSLSSENQEKDFLPKTGRCLCYHRVRATYHFFPFLPWLPGSSDEK